MKTPRKVFILENNEYIEITLQEHEALQKTMPGYLDKKFVFLHDCLMEVSESFYADFYKDKRRQKYLDECALHCGSISYDMLTTDDFNGEDILIDYDVDIAEEVAEKMTMEKLKQGIALLSDKEQELLNVLYFQRLSEQEWSKVSGIPQKTINDRKRRILAKLKNEKAYLYRFLEDGNILSCRNSYSQRTACRKVFYRALQR